MQVSLKALESMEAKAKNAKNAIQRVKAEAEQTVMAVVGGVETFGMTFSMGVINGRWGNPEILGIPVDLGAGLALHAVGFIVDEGADHMHNLGNGALCSYFGALGVGVGRKMLEEAQKAAQALAANAPVNP